MRSLSFSASLQGAITDPGFLLEITTGIGSIMRFSTRGEVTWEGQQWPRPFDVEDVQELAAGGVTASVRLIDYGGEIAVIALGNDPRGWKARLFIGNGDDFVTRLDGEVVEVPAIGDDIMLSLSSAGRANMTTPRIRVGEPFFSYSTPPGSIIDWGGERIILEAQDG